MSGFCLETKVKGSVSDVFKRFDRELFCFLKPPGFIAEIEKYEGNEQGNRVSVLFKLPWKSKMEVEIKEIVERPDHSYFTDEGCTMPFGITSWKHIHHVIASGNCVIIRDEVRFKTQSVFLTFFIYSAFYISFQLRKPQYKKYFGTCQ